MYLIRNVLIALDLSNMDQHIIPYAFYAAQTTETEVMRFAYVVENVDKTMRRLNIEAESEEAGLQKIEEMLHERVNTYKPDFAANNTFYEVKIELHRGVPYKTLLKLASDADTDLIVVGRRAVRRAEGFTPTKIIRRALCSVLCVTERAELKTEKILLPVDFTKYSEYAFKRALKFAENLDIKMIAHIPYKLPDNYRYAADRETTERNIRNNSEKKFKRFLKANLSKNEREICERIMTERYVLYETTTPAKSIYDTAVLEKVDMIVMGSRGLTTAAAFIKLDTADKLIVENVGIPQLVIKDKKKNLGFLRAIMEI